MWKFLKNLFKHKKLNRIAFEYDNETTVIGEKDKNGLWTVEVNTTKYLKEKDFKKILEKLKNIIKKGE